MNAPEPQPPCLDVNWQFAKDCAAKVAKSHHGLPFRIVSVESFEGRVSTVIRVKSVTELEAQ